MKYFVSPHGSNDNNGMTDSSAWRTIQHAINKLMSGDHLVIHQGVYLERLNIAEKGSKRRPGPEIGVEDHQPDILIEGAQGEVVVIDGSSNIDPPRRTEELFRDVGNHDWDQVG